ncbi:helix-turn-helix domain-containing protein [Formosa sp. S-31]|uniref:helix-turn-helix domain-containing protein n=1 Tax=Formosa sp. S-31 TaxID=2790949 RepID=UPI003EB70356
MENSQTILLYNITPEELKDMIVKDLKEELKAVLLDTKKQEYYSIEEVAEQLKCSKLTVHNYIKKGFLSAFKLGRRNYVKRVDLDKALIEVKSLRYKR